MKTVASMRWVVGLALLALGALGISESQARQTPGNFGKRKAMGSQSVEGRDCCALASEYEKNHLSKLEEALAGTSIGILGNKTTQRKCTLQREFYVT